MNLQDRMAEVFGRPAPRGVQAAIVDLCKVSRATVSNWFNNPEKVSTISRTHAEIICAQFGPDFSPLWLAEGVGEMRRRPPGLEAAVPVPPARLKEVAVVGRGNGGVMPQVIWTDGDFPAGATGEYGDGVASTDPHAFLAEVDGFSMVPKYTPGNFALVEPGTDIDIEDDVLVRLVSGETLLKRLVSRRGGYALSSYNDTVVRYLRPDEVEWMYYVVCPIPRKKIKMRT